MSKKIDSVLKEVLFKIEPQKTDLEFIEKSLQNFLKKINSNLKKLKFDVEIFVGGSFAKKTVIKKDYYDVDIFLRFDKKYKKENISELTKKILKGIKNVLTIHGSRDYYRIKLSNNSFLEVIPVMKVKSPRESDNVTDLSCSHVNYIKKKIKSQKILDDIKIAKAFAYANNCYGAESYVGGFSGYALELLVYHYGSFLKLIKSILKTKDRIIIDTEKNYKNKQILLMDINSSKLQSPIILVDPTYKQRNALAALTDETLEKFKKASSIFIKNPSIKSFEIQKIDLEKIKRDAQKNKFEFILLETKTNRQEGDIAGSKLLKFHRYLAVEISKYFEIKNKGFSYVGGKSSRCFFVIKPKKEIIYNGPNIKDKKNVKRFKKEHKKTLVKNKKLYAREKIKLGIKEFIKVWKNKNRKIIREMYIKKLEIK